MVAIVTIEYFNKPTEQFAVDVEAYKSYKHFIKAYRSFITRCNYDGAGTDLAYIGGYFKLHPTEYEFGTQVVISTKNVSKVFFELLEEDEFEEMLEIETCCCEECECEDEPNIMDEIDDKLFFINDTLENIEMKVDSLLGNKEVEEPTAVKKTKGRPRKQVLLESK